MIKLERFYSVADVREKFFPSRSTRWVKDAFKAGEYGPVLRDASGWLIAESAVLEYQARHAVGLQVVPLRSTQRANMRQAIGG